MTFLNLGDTKVSFKKKAENENWSGNIFNLR